MYCFINSVLLNTSGVNIEFCKPEETILSCFFFPSIVDIILLIDFSLAQFSHKRCLFFMPSGSLVPLYTTPNSISDSLS